MVIKAEFEGRNMSNWESLRDGYDDNDPDGCWAKEINSEKYGKYVWISDEIDGYEITTSRYLNNPIMICKTLKSAKRWVSMNIK